MVRPLDLPEVREAEMAEEALLLLLVLVPGPRGGGGPAPEAAHQQLVVGLDLDPLSGQSKHLLGIRHPPPLLT